MLNENEIIIDWMSPQIIHRIKNILHAKEALLQACKIKGKHMPLNIFDATAGFGIDSLIMAARDHTVTMCEIIPNIYLQLTTNMTKLATNEFFAPLIKNLSIYNYNSTELLLEMNKTFDIIYYDPMFDARKIHKSLPKARSQFLRENAYHSQKQDEIDFLNTAVKYAKHKVIIKRHKNAPQVSDLQPNAHIINNSVRFDIYQV